MRNMNENLDCGRAICGFRYGTDKIWIFEVPDDGNRGYYIGWLFYISGNVYFYSIAGGSEGLSTYIANTYAQYLYDNNDMRSLEPVMGETDTYVLDDDTDMAFNEVFEDAMMDAGFTMEEDSGRWVYADCHV